MNRSLYLAKVDDERKAEKRNLVEKKKKKPCRDINSLRGYCMFPTCHRTKSNRGDEIYTVTDSKLSTDHDEGNPQEHVSDANLTFLAQYHPTNPQKLLQDSDRGQRMQEPFTTSPQVLSLLSYLFLLYWSVNMFSL